MSENIGDLNPELKLLADALRSVPLRPAAINRDRLLYEAGRAAVRPGRTRLWQTATLMLAGSTVILAICLLNMPREPLIVEGVVVEVQMVPHPTETPQAELNTQAPPDANPVLATLPVASESRRMLQVRRDVLRWGVGMLPPGRAEEDATADVLTPREYKQWISDSADRIN